MQLEKLKAQELNLRKARIKQLKAGRRKLKKIDFKIAEAKFDLKRQQISKWVTFLLTASLADFLFCYITFGDLGVSVCNSEAGSIVVNLCVGWQTLFMLTFSIVILPITFLIGTVEFFQSIHQATNLKELNQQLQFQKDINIVSKVLVYSLFILAVQILIYFRAFEFLPDLLKVPFVVFNTDAMLPIALALLYYAVSQRIIFYSISSRLLYTVIVINLVTVFFSRGVQLLWKLGMERIF